MEAGKVHEKTSSLEIKYHKQKSDVHIDQKTSSQESDVSKEEIVINNKYVEKDAIGSYAINSHKEVPDNFIRSIHFTNNKSLFQGNGNSTILPNNRRKSTVDIHIVGRIREAIKAHNALDETRDKHKAKNEKRPIIRETYAKGGTGISSKRKRKNVIMIIADDMRPSIGVSELFYLLLF